MKKLSLATVVNASRISPNMIRVRLYSEAIASFPKDCAGGHIKLVIPPMKNDVRQFQKFLSSVNVRNQMRTYTIRHMDSAAGEIDVDFVAHGETGPASAWALSAQIGDFIALSSPGGSKLKVTSSGRYLIAVDMSAFPAAAAAVEKLPADAEGDFFADIVSQEDVQPINAPAGVTMHWVVNDEGGKGKALSQSIKTFELAGTESVFVAGEYDLVTELKSFFKSEKAYPKDQLYLSSYWKRGLIESQHKRVKTLVA